MFIKKYILVLILVAFLISSACADTQSDEKLDKDLGILSESWDVSVPLLTIPPDPHTTLGQPFFQQPSGSAQAAPGSPSHGG